MDAIGSSIGSATPSISPYTAPSYYAPKFRVTNCTAGGGGIGPVTISCYENSF